MKNAAELIKTILWSNEALRKKVGKNIFPIVGVVDSYPYAMYDLTITKGGSTKDGYWYTLSLELNGISNQSAMEAIEISSLMYEAFLSYLKAHPELGTTFEEPAEGYFEKSEAAYSDDLQAYACKHDIVIIYYR